jgi:PadR family transcriptional regulator, regulatory protein PadR
MMKDYQKQTQTKLTKGLLDMIILQYLEQEPMHGYQLITKIRKNFGVHFGPSTVYPLLGLLEKKGYVTSTWNMTAERPRKIYQLSNDGRNILNFAESSLNSICRNLTSKNKIHEQRTSIIAEPFEPVFCVKTIP